MATFMIETSARHVHVTQADLDVLFGQENYQLHNKKDLSQPGQFACEEKITVRGPKGELKASILGPVRPASQVELSLTDARSIGVVAPIRESGDVKGSGACTLVGPAGEVALAEGVIAAKRHIHMVPADAEALGVTDKQIVKVKTNGQRPLIFDDVVVRVHPNFALAMHIDTDEANAAYGATEGEIVL